MTYELDIGGIGVIDGIYKIASPRGGLDFKIEIGDKTISWTNDNLGYVPELVVHNIEGMPSPFLVFDSDPDKMLFKLNFAHLWQD